MPTAASKSRIDYLISLLDSLQFFFHKKEHFVYYFCYGSNLLIQRMRINNKSATKHANGLLTGFKLSFAGNSQLWKGATANIVQDSNVCLIAFNLFKSC